MTYFGFINVLNRNDVGRDPTFNHSHSMRVYAIGVNLKTYELYIKFGYTYINNIIIRN